MASTDCLESHQISRNCGRRLTLFIYFQYVVVNLRFQLYDDDIYIYSIITDCICSCYINCAVGSKYIGTFFTKLNTSI